MNTIHKGAITKISGTKATVATDEDIVIADAVIPSSLRTEGRLSIGTQVALILFEDNSACILTRTDGEYA